MSKIGISMMTYFSGKSFKAAQMPEIIHELYKEDSLGNSYGLPFKLDEAVYSKEELAYLKRSMPCRMMFALLSNINKRIVKIPHIYQKYEKIYGFLAKKYYRKNVPEVLVMKPRPSSLITHAKRKGACVIVEASESHTRFTCEQLLAEAKCLGVTLRESNYVDEAAIRDYEKGIEMADGVICLSEYSRRTYVERGISSEKIETVALNIDLSIDEPCTCEDEVTFVSVAMHSVLKGTYRLLKVWKEQQIKNKLVIVGPIDSELQSMIDQLGTIENVEFLGFKDYQFMREYYRNHRCVGLLLSLSEAFPRSVYECLCTSTPVIVTPVCTLDRVVDGVHGRIIGFSDENAIYDAVQMFQKMSIEEFRQYQWNVHEMMKEKKEAFGSAYLRAIESLADRVKNGQ